MAADNTTKQIGEALRRFNRLEIIDHRASFDGAARRLVIGPSDACFDVSVSIQDDDRTLKIFLSDPVSGQD
ncbi:hypothetical protein [uncultured Hyphomonas sp.]|uniref:hypothetical protein n=1 Tax=uncultured Hyphomonas sp. TaxID=225298 RepID=UPI002AAB11CD|nr:hypothetical protein [uncultured Hyphomonas sp.]